MSDSFAEKQTRILACIQQSKTLLESIHRSHVSDKFILLYPRGGGGVTSSIENKRGRGQSIVRSLRNGDFRLLALPEELSVHEGDMEEASLGRLMGTRLGECITYLERLRCRVSDKTSKILVTGDVNSGKSTFVNALLRKELLPTDQQPCTQCFCEVVPVSVEVTVKDNLCVHAMTDYDLYDPNNPRTFDRLSIAQMQNFIQDEETRYQLFRVFLAEEASSFAHDSEMDVSLIDSPGLNSDLFKTMSLFSKQEDIDVIVFLVNAANHLTLSAREFLETASREKAYIFIVVNKFDDIKNQEKCKRLVLGQIQEVLPKTFEDRSELIHFVSAGRFLKDKLAVVGAPKSASSVETNKIMELLEEVKGGNAEFLELECCLRDFILEKRTKSKLLPAQTYLVHLLGEVVGVMEFNRLRRKEDLCKVKHELEIITPCFDELMAHHGIIQADLRRTVEDTAQEVYEKSKNLLGQFGESISLVKEVPWRGVWGVMGFAQLVHNTVQQKSHLWLERVRAQALTQTISGLHLLHATATAHARQIFNSTLKIDEATITESIYKEAAINHTIPPSLSPWELFDISAFTRGSTWLSAATLAGAAFGYQPLLSLAVRVMDLSRSVGRLLTFTILSVAGGVALVALLGDLESMIRLRLQRHYVTFYQSSIWNHEPARALETLSRRILTEQHNGLVGRFEAALHQQRQLRAEKDLQRCQTETLVTYLDDQLRATHNLLDTIRQYSL